MFIGDLKGELQLTISKVHMKDRTNISLFPKFWRPNQFS